MTRQEQTNKRSLVFSQWIRTNLPDSKTGYCVTNQDWIFWNWKTRTILLCEEKTHNGEISIWFRRLIRDVLHPALEEYCKKNNITYKGYHLIQFENESPDDGKLYIDRKESTRDDLKALLTF
jgi:hypothetical protein